MYLTRAYPFPLQNNWFRSSLSSAVIVFLILYLLQPFGISNYNGNKLLFCLGYGVVTFCVSAPMTQILFLWLPKRVKAWKIWHHALAQMVFLLFIGIANFLFSIVISTAQPSFMALLVFMWWTIIIGVIITGITLILTYNRHLHDRLESLLVNTKEENKDIIITINDASVRGDNLELPLNSLLYIEASKNDVIVYYQSEGSIKKAELHNTLSAVLTDLQCYTNICQCHRSFIINVDNITSAKGNSNGYQLLLGECPNIIPVSRTFVSKLKSYIA